MSGELDPERDLVRTLNEKARPSRKRAGPGGSKDNSPTIAMNEGCWCGRPWNHAYPGKDEGAPHPRYPE